MITITKKFHFHAAHRNELLVGEKCASLHGHTYHADVVLKQRPPDAAGITMLFADIEEYARQVFDAIDHTTIIHTADPLYEVLKPFGMRLYPLATPTSAENVARHLFRELRYTVGLDVLSLSLQETTSSVVCYVEG